MVWSRSSRPGLFYADRLTTVSPTYAREIQTPAFGCGLDGLLRTRADALTGILNGVDPRVWDPRHDPILPRSYGVEDAASGKPIAKAALQRRLGLDDRQDAPLFGVVSRLTPQKGLDLLLACLPELVADGSRLAILGSGRQRSGARLFRGSRGPPRARSPSRSAMTKRCPI